MKEFFGIGGYQRPVEGYMSWQHLLFSFVVLTLMVIAAIFVGKKNQQATDARKNKVLLVSAIAIDALEIFKIVFLCFRSGDPMNWLYDLPLFLCSIQLITIPLAALSKGRLKNACLDFIMIFGILGALLGIVFAGNTFACNPVLSFDNVVSAATHAISGFVSLYIMISGMTSMHKKNIKIVVCVLLSFCFIAYIVNHIIDYNYMFLVRGDGTPYDIVYNFVNGNQILYPILVVVLFIVYITAFYGVYYGIRALCKRADEKN